MSKSLATADAFAAAVAAYERGDADAAERAARHVLQLDKQHADACYLLGAIALDRGDAAAALPFLQQAVRLLPQHLGVLRSLGLAYQAGGQAAEAAAALQAAVSRGVRDSAALNALGLALHELDEPQHAVAAFQEALRADPNDAGTYNNLAVVLNSLHDFEAAAAAYVKALEIDPSNNEIRSNLVTLYEQMNMLDEAEAEVARGLAFERSNPGLHLIAARCERRRGKAEEAIARLLPLVKGTATPAKTRRGMEFELGRAFDVLGDCDKAFGHFQAGNRLAAEVWPDLLAGAASYQADLDRMAQSYTPEALAGLPPSAAEGRSPAFLVSFPRSGTTLMDTFLDAHPDISVLEEEPPLHKVAEALYRRPGGLPQAVLGLSPSEIADLRELYWREVEKLIGPAARSTLVVDKNPFHSTHAPLIHRLFPDASFIFALRHPCAVTLSCFMQPFGRNPVLANFLDLETAALTYSKVMNLWHRYRASLPLRVHVLRYESLVADKRLEMQALTEFLGLQWREEILDHAAQAKKRGRIYTPSYHQVIRPIYTEAVNRWKGYEKYFGGAIDVLEPFVREFGYAL